jgi:uncharacterized SAM-binding protein YcdF (DUF218 family)
MPMKKLSAEFLKKVGDYMLVETSLARADVCIVFGGEQADALANRAADLYHKGYFPLLVVSGGVATSDGRLEAHRMRDVLLARGVPKDAILVEDKATNTGENVKFAMSMLARHTGLGKIGSVLGIGQIHGSRRFLMTLERQWPAVTKMFTAPNTFPVLRADWHQDSVFRTAVLREYAKIPKYKAHGFIAEVDMAALERKIALLPKPGAAAPKPAPKKPEL